MKQIAYQSVENLYLLGPYQYGLNRSMIKYVHTELVAFFVIAVEVDSTSLKHPPGNAALSEIWNMQVQTHDTVNWCLFSFKALNKYSWIESSQPLTAIVLIINKDMRINWLKKGSKLNV